MKQLSLEQINDIMDDKAYPVVIPTSEDIYASMMLQQATAEGHSGKTPRNAKRHEPMEEKAELVIAALAKHGPMSRNALAKALDVSPYSAYHYTQFARESGAVLHINKNTKRALFVLAGNGEPQ